MTTRRHLLQGLTLAPVAAALPSLGWAQAAWPGAKPITYVVPFTAGGTTDVVGRTITAKMAEGLKQTFVIENRAGTGGGLASTHVAKQPADGYTLIGGTISTHAINAGLYKNLGYDPVKDFEPVSLVGFLPNVLLVSTQLGVNTVAELIALMKKDDKQRTFASSGAGTSTHLAGELFADLVGLQLTHVPYKGTPPAMVDVSQGLVTFMFDQLTAALPLIQAGKMKLLAVTSPKRSPASPQTPTMVEAGVPGFEMFSWQAVYAPKGTPKPIIDRLHEEVVKALKTPEVKEKLATLGMEIVGSTPAELAALMAKEIPRWAALIKKSGASVN